MHVFADLQSYLCTHEDCRDALKTFPTRKLWVDHEFNEHFTLQQWRCFTCRATTSTQQSFVDHLNNNHNIVLTGYRLTAAIAEAQETDLTPEFINHKCALCSQSGWQTRKAYATHVGQHLEEISLACLPRDEGDSSDDALYTDTSSDVTGIDVLRNEQSEDREINTGSEIRSESISEYSPASYRSSMIVADETERQFFFLQELSPYIDPPPGEPPGNTNLNRRIPTEPDFPNTRNAFPLPWQSGISDYQSALNNQVNESLSARVHDIQTSAIDNTAIQYERSQRSSTPGSDWSRDKQRDYPGLLADQGPDFDDLAHEMKSKSPTMVRLLRLSLMFISDIPKDA